ncbi:efflux RND transporter periplasmic adaptor subunit [Roseivirga sp.]|uniref:efflux RND transporter periplasmic adaptor subunit n=1 Tax=Roseivirga sp. TaxID=1964215 RepID=UPI003B8ACE1E
MRNKLIIFSIAIIAVIIVAVQVFNPAKAEESAVLFAEAERGEFTVEVTTTGELSAERSTKIIGPAAARDFGIRQMTIQRLVEEGTQVSEGEFVAQLDPGELYDKIQAEKDRLTAEIAEYDNAKIDTALTLSGERDKLINLDYNIEEKKLQLEQSQYEPPATIKKYENELEKLKRDKVRANENYVLKIQQAKSKLIEATSDLKRVRDRYDRMNNLISDFTITAPQSGMVIYTKGGFGGDRVVEGSQINVWSPDVAELPDLSSMISTTFINEVDIRKVKPGQPVEMGLDAFPEKKLTGKVMRVARVGQQNPNSDAKVFEVVVRLNERDSDLRPAMTTSNIIVTERLEDVVFVPLECLHVYNDSINYVVKKGGILQEVKVSKTNSNEAVIDLGVEAGDMLYMSLPESLDGKEPNLIPELNGTRMQKYEAAPEQLLNEEWLMPDGSPMNQRIIDVLKQRGAKTPAEGLEMMKSFGGGNRGGGRPRGGAATSGAATSGQPSN